MKLSDKKTKGFTLVETLVAIAVLLMGLAGIFSALQIGLSSTSAIRNRLTATFLAQEGFEAVKNIKDTNILRISYTDPNTDWLDGIRNVCTEDSPCGYDVTKGSNSNPAPSDDGLISCAGSSGNCAVKKDPCPETSSVASYFRQMSAAEGSSNTCDTGFTRDIYVTENPVDQKEALVRVVVTHPKLTRPVIVENYIYNYWP